MSTIRTALEAAREFVAGYRRMIGAWSADSDDLLVGVNALLAQIDAALAEQQAIAAQSMDGASRPPTPVGWSDTDWIKHLQEQDEQPHPLAGQHINQGSMDAAADAYEAEYNAARGIT